MHQLVSEDTPAQLFAEPSHDDGDVLSRSILNDKPPILRLESKYLIESKGFFSRTSYHVLNIQETSFSIYPLNNEVEEVKETGLKIDWKNVIGIVASNRDAEEFTISYSIGSKGKDNITSVAYSCQQRIRLISDVLYKLQTLGPNLASQTLIEPALYTPLPSDTSSVHQELVCLYLHQSILVIKVCPSSKGPLLREYDHESQEESKIQSPGPEDELTLAPQLVDSTSIPSRNLGSLHQVYLCEISHLYSCGKYLLLRTSHGEFLSFRLRGPDRVKALSDKLIENLVKLGGGLKEGGPERKSIRECSEAFLKRKDEGLRRYAQECRKVGWDGVKREVRVEVDDEKIYEVKGENIIREYSLKDLKTVNIKKRTDFLSLIFNNLQEVQLELENEYQRNHLLSLILTLRTFLIPEKGTLDNFIFLDSADIDQNALIRGFQISINQSQQVLPPKPQHLSDFETSLLRALSDSLLHDKDSMPLLHTLLSNCTFYGLSKLDPNLHLRPFLSYFQSLLSAQPKDQAQLLAYLNAFSVLCNSSSFFLELGEYPEILDQLSHLIFQEGSMIVKLAASQALRQAIQYYSKEEFNAEYLHKKALISGTGQGNGVFVPLLREWLIQYDHAHDLVLNVDKKADTIGVVCVGQVLRSIMSVRKNSTNPEEFQKVAKMIVEDEENKDEGRGQEKNKAIIHLIERFIMNKDKSLVLQYYFTQFLSDSLWYFRLYSPDQILPSLQAYVQTYSISFLWHLRTVLDLSAHPALKSASTNLLAYLIYGSSSCYGLLLKCIPSSLLSKVPTHLDLTASGIRWTETEWDSFFNHVLAQDHLATPTEHWSTNTRQDLLNTLTREIEVFTSAQRKHWLVARGIGGSEGSIQKIEMPGHQYDGRQRGRVVTKESNVRWNIQEFEVTYRCNEDLVKVDRYFLKKLIVEKTGVQPKIACEVHNPKELFEEIKVQLMSTFDPERNSCLLKALVLLYKKYFKELGPIKIYPYTAILFTQDTFQSCKVLLLQFILVTFAVEDSALAHKNIKKFIKSSGLSILRGQLKESIEEPVSDILDSSHMNYTNSNTISRYLTRNPLPVCKAIIVLKILAVALRDSQHALANIPPSAILAFLLQPENLSLIAMLLYKNRGNRDLVREMTYFLLITPLVKTHFFYSQLKNTGMIEIMILQLSSQKNGERALQILRTFQEVAFDYNSHNLKMGQFSPNDINVLIEDKKETEVEGPMTIEDIKEKRMKVLAESIFLRYFPLPLLKFLYEKGEKAFLEAYQAEDFTSPILIWNSQLRIHLESTLIDYFDAMIIEQQALNSEVPLSEIFNEVQDWKFQDIIQYKSLNNEVRCGRYYLRVWVNQLKPNSPDRQPLDPLFFDIPHDEEEDFHKNLQAELKQAIYEEANSTDQVWQHKVIILFKACLLTLRRFNRKRLTAKDEVKRIMLDLCLKLGKDDEDLVYSKDIKQIFYLGCKILYEFVKHNVVEMREYLSKMCMEIVLAIFEVMINRSVRSRKVDRVEVKAMTLCFAAFNEIMNSEILAFTQFDQHERIKLLRQTSSLLTFGFELLPLFKDSQLSPNLPAFFKDPGERHQKNMATGAHKKDFFSPEFAPPLKPKRPIVQFNFDSNKLSPVIQGSSQSSQNQSPQIIRDHGQKRQRQMRQRDQDYADLLQNVRESSDKYASELICKMMRQSAEMIKQLTKLPALHSEIILTNVAWKCLKAIFFQLKEEVTHIIDLKETLRLCVTSLKNLTSFSSSLSNLGVEAFALKSLDHEPLIHFYQCLKRFFVSRFLSLLTQEFTILSSEELNFHQGDFNPKPFLQLFSISDISISELVWNSETRAELAAILDYQLLSINDEEHPSSIISKVTEFEYSVNLMELRVDEVFVKYYTQEGDRYRPTKPQEFGRKLIMKIKDYVQGEERKDGDEANQRHICELLNAFKTLIRREVDYHITEASTFEEYSDVLCSIMDIQSFQMDQECMKTLGEKVIDIFTHLILYSTKANIYIELLQDHDEFIKLLIKGFYMKGKGIISKDRLIYLIQIMLSSKDLKPDLFLVNQGLLFFLLDHIFTSENSTSSRIECLRILFHTATSTEALSQCFLPKRFFLEFFAKNRDVYQGQHLHTKHLYAFNTYATNCLDEEDFAFASNEESKSPTERRVSSKIRLNVQPVPQTQTTERNQHKENELLGKELERIIEFLGNEIDSHHYESVFVIWNSEMKRENHMRIRHNCEEIVKGLKDRGYQPKLDVAGIDCSLLESEIRVKEVIVRVYNRNPSVFIREKLNNFILDICKETNLVARELFDLRKQNIEEDIRIELQPKFEHLCHKSSLLLSSLLLSLEQLLFNDANQNRMLASGAIGSGGNPNSTRATRDLSYGMFDNKIYKNFIDKTTDHVQVDHEVFRLLEFWMQQQVFMKPIKEMPDVIRITFLQILLLIIDVGDAVKVMLDNQSIIQFVIEAVTGIVNQRYKSTIEEMLILMIIYKLIVKDSQVIPLLTAKKTSAFTSQGQAPPSQDRDSQRNSGLALSNRGSSEVQTSSQATLNLTFLRDLFEILNRSKDPHSIQLHIILLIFQKLQCDSQYVQHILNQINSLQNQFKLNPKVLEQKNPSLDTALFSNALWRANSLRHPPPSKSSVSSPPADGAKKTQRSSKQHAQQQQVAQPTTYRHEQCMKIEDVMGWSETVKAVSWEEVTERGKIRLPLIARGSVQCFVKRYREEEKEEEDFDPISIIKGQQSAEDFEERESQEKIIQKKMQREAKQGDDDK